MKKKYGTALIITLLITSLLSMLALRFWFMMSVHWDITSQRELFYERLYAIEDVLVAALSLVKKDFRRMSRQLAIEKKPIRLLPQGYDAQKTIMSVGQAENRPESLLVNVRLVHNNHVTHEGRCLLSKKQGAGGEEQFVVECFTLSSGL